MVAVGRNLDSPQGPRVRRCLALLHVSYTFNAMTETTQRPLIDVRILPPPERHRMIFATFGQLAPGEAMELVNDHDPRPLHYQFEIQMPGLYSWNYLEEGPHVWRVAIGRAPIKQAATASAGCGSGGGCGCSGG